MPDRLTELTIEEQTREEIMDDFGQTICGWDQPDAVNSYRPLRIHQLSSRHQDISRGCSYALSIFWEAPRNTMTTAEWNFDQIPFSRRRSSTATQSPTAHILATMTAMPTLLRHTTTPTQTRRHRRQQRRVRCLKVVAVINLVVRSLVLRLHRRLMTVKAGRLQKRSY